MPAILRTALCLAVIAASVVAIFFPDLRSHARPFVVALSLITTADMFVHAWRAGHLHKSFGDLAKSPPRTTAVELMATVLGLIALLLVL